ncbi:MAG: DUF5681 domain-containing protein [Sphingomicrobium sp.]
MAKRRDVKHSPSGDYAVGYCRPPENGRIKPGEVRNPLGKNRKAEPHIDAFETARARKTRVTIDGETVMMASDEAFWMKQMAMALAGDKAAARNVAKELGARRNMMPKPDPEQEAADLAKRKELTGRLVEALEFMASHKKHSAPRVSYGSTPSGASGASFSTALPEQ